MNSMVLDKLVAEREQAKLEESDAILRRRSLDAQICELIGKVDEGTLFVDLGGKRVTVTYGLDYKVEKEKAADLEKLIPLMPPHVLACIRTKREISVRQYKDLQVSDPASFAFISGCVTVKPKSPTIDIEERKAS